MRYDIITNFAKLTIQQKIWANINFVCQANNLKNKPYS